MEAQRSACETRARPTTIEEGEYGAAGGTPAASGASMQYGENSVEEPLKRLMQELGNAINDSLSESDRIAEAIGEIKKSGYDVFLVLEATIGFNRRDGDEEDAEDLEMAEEQQAPQPPRKTFEASGKIKLTTQDHRFLRALKIAVDDDR